MINMVNARYEERYICANCNTTYSTYDDAKDCCPVEKRYRYICDKCEDDFSDKELADECCNDEDE